MFVTKIDISVTIRWQRWLWCGGRGGGVGGGCEEGIDVPEWRMVRTVGGFSDKFSQLQFYQ